MTEDDSVTDTSESCIIRTWISYDSCLKIFVYIDFTTTYEFIIIRGSILDSIDRGDHTIGRSHYIFIS